MTTVKETPLPPATTEKKESHQTVIVKLDPTAINDDKKHQTDHDEASSSTQVSTKPSVFQQDKSIVSTKRFRRRQDSSYFAQWTWSFMDPLIARGYRHLLTTDELPDIETDDEATHLSHRIQAAWELELKTHGKKASIIRSIVKVFWRPIFLGGAGYLFESLVKIGQGLVLGELLRWFQNPLGTARDGYLLALGLIATSLLHAISHHVCFYYGIRLGMQLRIGFIAYIYRKCLHLSTSHTSSTGFLMNLVSNDVQRFEDLSPFVHFIWLGPVETAIILYCLYREISWAGFAAMGALLLLLPIQAFFARQFSIFRKKVVLFRDERIKSLSDMLLGIMVVKLYAWEKPFIKHINKLRDEEMIIVRKAAVLRAINEAMFFFSPAIMSLFAFGSYWLIGGTLTPSRVFAVITFLQTTRLTMSNFFPKALQFASESLVSLNRIRDVLSLPEMGHDRDLEAERRILKEQNDPDAAIVIKNGSFGWSTSATEDKKPILNNINLVVRRGQWTAVCGPVGSGKSSLLNAILGEMTRVEGVLASSEKKIGYVSQTAWLVSGTVRDNILFGSEYHEEWFDRVVHACALTRDIQLFPDGIHTLIGERGVTLSGGQKARISLARAVYANCQIYLLDDPLSAVDTTVGKHLFEHCITGILKDKAVVLVTHQLQYLRDCPQVVIMEGGSIAISGPFNQVSSSSAKYAEMLRELSQKTDHFEMEEDELADIVEEGAAPGDVDSKIGKKEVTDQVGDTITKRSETVKGDGKQSRKELKQEEMAVGSVTLSTFVRYFTYGGGLFGMITLLLSLMAGQAMLMFTDWWLAHWSNKSSDESSRGYYVWVFLLLSLLTVVVSIARAIGFFMLACNTSIRLFREMVVSVFRSPMSFFQVNPHGRLMNRFSKDMNLVDESLPQVFFDLIQCSFIVFGTFILSGVMIPFALIAIPIIGTLFYFLRKYYISTSRQLKRLESVTRSPVYSNFPATLEGLSLIRAFGAESRFLDTFMGLQNENTRTFFMFLQSSRWLGFRLDMMSVTFVTLVTLLSIAAKSFLNLSPGVIGLVLSYCLQLTGLLQWAVRQSAEVETLMVSTERVFEYGKLESEAEEITSVRPPDDWPSKGRLELQGMSMSYKLANVVGRRVLQDLTLKVDEGLKVGIVGRTGAGKSSFLQALFRIVEPTPERSIIIDGIPTSDLGLYDLRSRLSIIPQEPFCFRGTLRFNLDPFDMYTDEQLWKALEAVELKPIVEKMPTKLSSPVSENGSNWSVGERQLICLARAILKNTKFIVLDEATSSIDPRTDKLVQQAIRASDGLFANATVLTVAHRLNTIIDYDRIMVLDDGKLVEYGTPSELLDKDPSNTNAWFARMVNDMGEDARRALIEMANNSQGKKLA